jgi:Ca-activated chloride channel homolog
MKTGVRIGLAASVLVVSGIALLGSATPVSGNGIIIVVPPEVPVPPVPPEVPVPPVPPPILPPPPHPHPPIPPHWPRPIDGWIPFTIKSQQVDAMINDGVAETTIEQVFENRGGRPLEGTYLFAVADNAGVQSFTMWMNGKETTAELLDADKARQIYESIVAKMRDPALLEYAGRGLIRAKVFPIPAGGECRVRLRYSEPLLRDAGFTSYRFPLQAQECSRQPVGRFSLKATIRSERPLSGVFSPSHECSIDRRGEREVVVGLEQTNLMPDRDFQLFWQTGGEPFGLMLLTHRVSGTDGFFMARITPRSGVDDASPMPKNICFVLDTSGSMAEDNKIAQAKTALKFCLTNLGKEDRFSLITFATEVRRFRDDWSGTDEGTLNAARAFVDGMQAVGGTDIDGAIKQALAMNPAGGGGAGGSSAMEPWRKNPYFLVFITDGEPTVGVTDPAQILKDVAAANAAKAARLFVLGVGYKVNTKLLDRMADDNGGARDYVTPTENLELKLSAFYTKLANPVLASLKLIFKGLSVSDVYPKTLPDLFKGSELEVLGRYSGSDSEAREIELSGTCRGETRVHSYTGKFPVEQSSNDYLPRLWAMRKIGFLLDELRLHGESKELKDEVIRLSKLHGIMTPYTSYLVLEDEKTAMRGGRPAAGPRSMMPAMREAFARNEVSMKSADAGQQAAVGGGSVEASRDNVLMQAAKPASTTAMLAGVQAFNADAAGRVSMNFIGSKTFYREGDRWVDAEYDGKAKPVALNLFSKEYYDFVAANAKAGRYLAQGERVVLCWNGQVYETVADRETPPAP